MDLQSVNKGGLWTYNQWVKVMNFGSKIYYLVTFTILKITITIVNYNNSKSKL